MAACVMTEIPEAAGKVVSMVEFQGKIIIACEFAVFRMREEQDVRTLKVVQIFDTLLTVPHSKADT